MAPCLPYASHGRLPRAALAIVVAVSVANAKEAAPQDDEVSLFQMAEAAEVTKAEPEQASGGFFSISEQLVFFHGWGINRTRGCRDEG